MERLERLEGVGHDPAKPAVNAQKLLEALSFPASGELWKRGR